MGRPDRAVTMRIPADLYEKIERMARGQHRSVSSMVTYMLDLSVENWDYLAKQALERELARRNQQIEENTEENFMPSLAAA